MAKTLGPGRLRADDIASRVDPVPLAIIAEPELILKGLNAGRGRRRGWRDVFRGRSRGINHRARRHIGLVGPPAAGIELPADAAVIGAGPSLQAVGIAGI